MGLDVTAETTIARPPATVATVMFDPAHDTTWIGGISSARGLGEPGLVVVGTQVTRVASFLGKRIEYVNEVVELDLHRLVMKSVKSPFPMTVTYEVDPLEDPESSIARVRVQGDASGFYGLANRAMAPMVRRSISGDVQRLRDLVEST